MTQLSARILAQCLDAMDRGDATLEECLARHPQHREELMPILKMATMLRDDPSAGPRPLFRRTARQRLLDKLPPRTPDRRSILRWPFWQTLPRRAAAWVAVAVTFVVILGSSGIVYAGARTLPGDTLYPVKTTVEEARLWVARGEDEVHLSLRFAEDRIQEIRRLGTIGRLSDVTTAASRFGVHLRCADEALLELAEHEPELAATLALQAEKARTEYRQELNGLLRTVPDAERPAIEGVLDLDDDPDAHDLYKDGDEREVPFPTGTDEDSSQRKDDLPDDDGQPLAVQPVDTDDHDTPDSEDVRDDPDTTDEAPERPEPEEGTGSGQDRDDSGDQDGDDEREGDHDPGPGEPEQDHPDADDDSGNTPEPAGGGDGDGGSDHDDDKGDESDDGDDSDDEDDSDDRHDADSEDDSDQDDHSDREHDGEGERDG